MKIYSVCCYAHMPDFPDSDICPRCGEHSWVIDEEEHGDPEDNEEIVRGIDL